MVAPQPSKATVVRVAHEPGSPPPGRGAAEAFARALSRCRPGVSRFATGRCHRRLRRQRVPPAAAERGSRQRQAERKVTRGGFTPGSIDAACERSARHPDPSARSPSACVPMPIAASSTVRAPAPQCSPMSDANASLAWRRLPPSSRRRDGTASPTHRKTPGRHAMPLWSNAGSERRRRLWSGSLKRYPFARGRTVPFGSSRNHEVGSLSHVARDIVAHPWQATCLPRHLDCPCKI